MKVRKFLFALVILAFANSFFALYQFNATVVPLKNITVNDSYGSAELNFLYYFNGTLYITDSGGTPNVLYYTNETGILPIGGAYLSPMSVYISDNKKTYVADSSIGLVRRSSGTYTVLNHDLSPEGVAIINDTIFLSDTQHSRIAVAGSDGIIGYYLGRNGTLTGEFDRPEKMQAQGGIIYVADSGNGRVEAFYPNFTHVQTYGSGIGDVFLKNPRGLWVDDDYVYVADEEGNKIVIYTKDGYPIFIYNMTSPRDVVIGNKTMFVSLGDRESVFRANFTIPRPAEYAQYAFDSLSPTFAKYKVNADDAGALGIPYNGSIISAWAAAKLSLDNGLYGESFYHSMDLGQADISSQSDSLETALGAKILALAQNSSAKSNISFLVGNKNYPTAYAMLVSAPLAKPNVSMNETPAANVTHYDVSPIADRLAATKALMSDYNITLSTSSLEAQLALAATNGTAYQSAQLMMDALDEKVNLIVYKINGAKEKSDKLKGEIAKGGLFVDYSKASAYAMNATALAYSDPAASGQAADAGLAELQKARDTASQITYILLFVVILAAVVAVLFFAFKHHLLPADDDYHFKEHPVQKEKKE